LARPADTTTGIAIGGSLALYVHFPWCVRKCPYCDFNSHPLTEPLPEASYLDALLADLAAQLPMLDRRRIHSLFFGGGTPSLFSPASFAALIERLAGLLTEDVEITLEANPGTTEHADWHGYRSAGINRLSLGAQSFDGAQLGRLGRVHGPGDTFRAVADARRAGFDNLNLDLMYALPEQAPAEAALDLATALDLAPDHLSWYQLTIEPRTEFAGRPPPLPAEDAVAVMETEGWARLADAGFDRYEVSAYARAGRRCRHNLGYWTFGDYLGVGAGAHGKVTLASGPLRTRKARQPRLYLADPTRHHLEPIPRAALAGEYLLNALRLVDGVSVAEFESTTGLTVDTLEPARQELVDLGLLRPDRLATTPLGYRWLDSVVGRFLGED